MLTDVINALETQLGGGPELIPEQGDVMGWDEVAPCRERASISAPTPWTTLC